MELHAHTSADPHDYIPHSATDLIDRAATLGYDVLAITLHDRCFDVSELIPYARARGITLIPGVERTIEHKHVLLLNFGDRAERVDSFKGLAELRRSHPAGLVIAPHPFYPAPSCLGRLLDRHADLFDAVEFNAFYVAGLNLFNRAATRWARQHGKTVVANADIHRLNQLGTTYSLVDAEPEPNAICAAIRGGKVEIRAAPLSLIQAATYLADLALAEFVHSRQTPKSAGNLLRFG